MALKSPGFSGTWYGGAPARPSLFVQNVANAVGFIGKCGFRPPPSSSYKPSPFYTNDRTFQPALESDHVAAYVKGLQKYTRVRFVLLDRTVNRFIRIYNIMFSTYLQKSVTLSYEDACALLEPDKSPGSPYYYNCASKEMAFELYDIDKIVSDELRGYWQDTIYSTTLKDELRLIGKEARMFTPAPMHSTIIGNMFYADQNDCIIKNRAHHPIKIGVQMPGHEFTHLLLDLPSDWDKYHFDVRGFDSTFLLSIASAICTFRKQFISQHLHKAHKRWYANTYCGLVYWLGYLLYLVGQRSGSTNTGMDNSFEMVGIVLDAVCELSGVKLRNLHKVFKLVDGSDDACFAVHPALREKVNIVTIATYIWQNYGLLLESPSLDPSPRDEIYFFSHHLVPVDLSHLNLGTVWLALGNAEKIVDGFSFIKHENVFLQLQRYVALLINLYPAQMLFKKYLVKVRKWAAKQTVESDEWIGMLYLMNDELFYLAIHSGLALPNPRALSD